MGKRKGFKLHSEVWAFIESGGSTPVVCASTSTKVSSSVDLDSKGERRWVHDDGERGSATMHAPSGSRHAARLWQTEFEQLNDYCVCNDLNAEEERDVLQRMSHSGPVSEKSFEPLVVGEQIDIRPLLGLRLYARRGLGALCLEHGLENESVTIFIERLLLASAHALALKGFSERGRYHEPTMNEAAGATSRAAAAHWILSQKEHKPRSLPEYVVPFGEPEPTDADIVRLAGWKQLREGSDSFSGVLVAIVGCCRAILAIVNGPDTPRDASKDTLTHYGEYIVAKEDLVLEPKGMGVVCVAAEGIPADHFVQFYLGEVYPAWRWWEKEDAVKEVQRRDFANRFIVPDFFNITLERESSVVGSSDPQGYDVLFVEPRYKANFPSRLSHSCDPNCENKVVSVNWQGKQCVRVAMRTTRFINPGEELTFDYCAVSDSEAEVRWATCLCGTEKCRGSLFSLSNRKMFLQIMHQWHTFVDRTAAVVFSCLDNRAELSEADRNILFELRQIAFNDLPVWCVRWAAAICRFIDKECSELPSELERALPQYYGAGTGVDSKGEAEAVKEARIMSLVVTLDKSCIQIRHVLRMQPESLRSMPPLRTLTTDEVVEFLWSGDHSLAKRVTGCLREAIVGSEARRTELMALAMTPLNAADTVSKEAEARKRLLNLAAALRSVEPKANGYSRLWLPADMLILYARTHNFFTLNLFEKHEGAPYVVLPTDLSSEPAFLEEFSGKQWSQRKTYGPRYILSQLLYWFQHDDLKPELSFASDRRGCIAMPTIESSFSEINRKQRKEFLRSLCVEYDKFGVHNACKDWLGWLKVGHHISSPLSFGIDRAQQETTGVVYGSPFLDAAVLHLSISCGCGPTDHSSEWCADLLEWEPLSLQVKMGSAPSVSFRAVINRRMTIEDSDLRCFSQQRGESSHVTKKSALGAKRKRGDGHRAESDEQMSNSAPDVSAMVVTPETVHCTPTPASTECVKLPQHQACADQNYCEAIGLVDMSSGES